MKKFWTLEKCIEIAKKCNSRSEFKKEYPGAWDFGFDNNLLMKIYPHLKNPKNLTKIWTKDKCRSVCLRYDNLKIFRKNEPKVYDALLRNNWIGELTSHMFRKNKPAKYWTLCRCYNSAKNFKTKKEWIEKSYKSYSAANKNGWVDICSNHMINLNSSFKRIIYSYEFSDNSVYVGLTYDLIQRDNNHKKDKKSQIHKKILKSNFNYKLKTHSSYIKAEDASKLEGVILNEYKNNGWNVLNIAKTGGLGGSRSKYTKEGCILEAMKYEHRSDFKRESGSIYNHARKMGWLSECCEHMKYKQLPNGYWLNNKKKCVEELLKYNKISHFKIGSCCAYQAMRKNNWSEEFKKILNDKR